MPRTRPAYPPEMRQKIVELARSGRTVATLAKEFEPTEIAIRNWIAQADRDAGVRSDSLTADERKELNRLRREVRTLREERDILKKQQRGSRRRGDRRDTTKAFGYMKAQEDRFPIATMSWVLEVSRSGFYAWSVRTPSRDVLSRTPS
ncbi:MAG: transposase [Chloroflexi bacterium]|nr:transposase [Chloroflexota bacterium]